MKKRAITEKSGRNSAMLGGVLLVILLVAAGFLLRNKLFTGQQGEQAPPETTQAEPGVEGSSGRGNIYDRNFVELAVGFRRSSIYARPLELDSPEQVAHKVGQVLGVDEKDLLPALKGERSFSWLGRDIPLDKADKIAEENLKGVYRFDQIYRYYPGNQIGAHVIGFLKDEQGLAGVEFSYDSILRGGGGYEPRLAAAGASRRVVEGQEGANLVLTIDLRAQELLEQRLRGLVVATGAKSAMAGIMVPDTGEIIALANLPTYDLNRFWEFGTDERRDRFVDDIFDLIGVGRLFRAAAALDLRMVPNLDKWGARGEMLRGDQMRGGEQAAAAPGEEATAQPAETTQLPWNWVQNNVFVSPEAVGLGQFGVDSIEFGRFAERVGLNSRGEIDLPETLFSMKEPEVVQAGKGMEAEGGEGGAESVKLPAPPQERGESVSSATPMAMLTAFCRLINGGRAITPHVLSAVWADDQVWDMPVKQAATPLGVRPEVSTALLEGMRKWRPAGQDLFVLESLLQKGMPPQPAKAVIEAEDAKKVQTEPASPTEGAAAAPAPQPQPVVNSILLATAELQHPDLALVIVLEGARINPHEASPVRGGVAELLAQTRLTLQKRQPRPSAEELAKREGDFYRKWQANQEKANLAPAANQGAQGVVMPDVRGLSMRKSLQVLQQYGLRVQLSGAGQVIRQSPAPGASLKGVDQCTLELKVMQ